MGSCVCHTVLRIIVRKIIVGAAGISGIKRKLQDLHSRESTVMDKLTHRICHIAKILRNDLLPAKGLLHFAEQIDPGTFFPVTANSIFRTIWNGKILVKATEMINSYHIIKAEYVAQSGYPPLISRISVIIPAIQWISPELSCCGKSVWRHPATATGTFSSSSWKSSG